MQYVRVKHKKTGEERIFTQPVFEANQHHYKFIEYTDNPNAGAKKQADAQQERKFGKEPGTPAAKAPVKTTGFKAPKAAATSGNDAIDETLEDLKAEYTKLTGKAPDKRWKTVAKLTEKIKEVQFKDL